MSLELSNVKQVENFFPKYIHKELWLMSSKVKYDYMPTITYTSIQKQQLSWINECNKHRNIQDSYGFSGILEPKSEEYEKVSGLVKFYTKKVFDIEIEKFLRIMFVILPPNPLYQDGYQMLPHVDIGATTKPIKNLLYFLNDNDAPTVYYDQQVNDMDNVDFSNMSIIEKVFPKIGKASVWDGSIVHSASVSKTNIRITLNVLFESMYK